MGRGNDASVAAALAAYRSGRAADARGIAEKIWSGSSDAVARHPELNGERSRDTAFVARSVPGAAQAMALVDNWARMNKVN